MTIEDIKEELEKAGYEIEVGWFPPGIGGKRILIFQKEISVDRVKISLGSRGWVIIDTKQKDRGRGYDLWKYYVLKKNKAEIEIQPLMYSNVILNFKSDPGSFF